jgi:hypothetical protein
VRAQAALELAVAERDRLYATALELARLVGAGYMRAEDQITLREALATLAELRSM